MIELSVIRFTNRDLCSSNLRCYCILALNKYDYEQKKTQIICSPNYPIELYFARALNRRVQSNGHRRGQLNTTISLSHGVKKKIFGNPKVRLVTTTALMPMKRSWCRVAVDSFISRPFVNMVPVSFLFVGKIIIIRGYINISRNFVGNIKHYSPNFNSNMIILAFSKRLPRYCWMQNSNAEGIQWLSRVFANQAISKLK